MKSTGKCTGKLTIASSFLLALCMAAVPADAQPPSSKNTKPKPPRDLLLLKPGGHYPIQVARARHTFLDFPGEIRDHNRAVDHPYFNVRKVRPTRLRIIPAPNAPMDARLDVAVDFVVDNVTFNLQLGTEEQADHQVNVYLANIAALNALAARTAQPAIEKAEDRADQAEGRADQAEKNTENERLRLQSQALINQINGTPHCKKPLYPVFETNGGRVTWRLFESCWDESKVHLLVPFEVENGDVRPFRAIRTVIVTDRQRKQYPAHIALIDEIARPATRQPGSTIATPGITADAPADPKSDPQNAASQNAPVPLGAVIGVQQTARGVIAIRLDNAPSVDQLRIRLAEPHSDPDKVRYLQALVTSWSLHRPNVAPYTADDWAREVARREARQARATQLILGPSGSAGACWLPDGQDETNLDSTECFVFGIRLTKGITELIAFEVEAIGGWTGDARFDGETRSARFGRVTGSGLLRFGQFTIPYFRAGIGAQGLSFSGQGSSSEFSGLTIFGGGLARRVGEHLIASASVSTVTRGLDELRTFEVGIHLGYGWNP